MFLKHVRKDAYECEHSKIDRPYEYVEHLNIACFAMCEWKYGPLKITIKINVTWSPSQNILLTYLGVIQNCHHFHDESTQSTLRGGGGSMVTMHFSKC